MERVFREGGFLSFSETGAAAIDRVPVLSAARTSTWRPQLPSSSVKYVFCVGDAHPQSSVYTGLRIGCEGQDVDLTAASGRHT